MVCTFGLTNWCILYIYIVIFVIFFSSFIMHNFTSLCRIVLNVFAIYLKTTQGLLLLIFSGLGRFDQPYNCIEYENGVSDQIVINRNALDEFIGVN